MWSIDECEVSPWLLLFPMVLGLHSVFYHFFLKRIGKHESCRHSHFFCSHTMFKAFKGAHSESQTTSSPSWYCFPKKHSGGNSLLSLSFTEVFLFVQEKKFANEFPGHLLKKDSFGFPLFLCLFLILTILSDREKEHETGWRSREVMRI